MTWDAELGSGALVPGNSCVRHPDMEGIRSPSSSPWSHCVSEAGPMQELTKTGRGVVAACGIHLHSYFRPPSLDLSWAVHTSVSAMHACPVATPSTWTVQPAAWVDVPSRQHASWDCMCAKAFVAAPSAVQGVHSRCRLGLCL